MVEAYSVKSQLNFSTNAPGVLRQLIEGFENIDKVLKSTQENVGKLESTLGKMGKGKAGVQQILETMEKLSNVKMGGSLLADLGKAAQLSVAAAEAHALIRTSAMETAAAWRQIANSMRQAHSGGSGGGGAGGAGGGGRKRNPLFGDKDDWPNAQWMDRDDTARHNTTRKLAEHENATIDAQAANLRKLAEYQNAQMAAEVAHMHKMAEAENANFDLKAKHIRALAEMQNASHDAAYKRDRAEAEYHQQTLVAQERERAKQAKAEDARRAQKFKDDHALATRENQDRDARAKAEARASAGKPFSHHELGNAAVGFQMAGSAGTGFFKDAVMQGFDYEHRMAILTGDTRVTPADERDIRKQIDQTTRNVPGSTKAGNIEILTDLKNTFGDLQEARDNLEPFVKLVTTLQMANLRHGGSGDMKEALNMARFIEDQGGAIDPAHPGEYNKEKFNEIANRAIAIYVATQGRVAPREMLAFQKMARSGGMLMNDHALYEETPFFAQGFGASKLGTAIFSDVQVMLANRMTQKTADGLGDMGLYEKKHWVGKGKKRHEEWDQSTIKDKQLLISDPYKWIHDTLGGNVARSLKVDANTKDGQEAIILKMTELAQRGTIAGLWTDVYRNYGVAQKEGKNITAQDPEMMKHFSEKDPLAQLMVFKAAENEFMVTIGELLKGPAVEYLKQLTEALRGLVDWINKQPPDTAAKMAEAAATAAIAVKVFGDLAMAAFFLGPVVSMFKTLASALSPFGPGGAGASGLEGLVLLLRRVSLIAALLVPGFNVESQKNEDTITGKDGKDPKRFDHFGGSKWKFTPTPTGGSDPINTEWERQQSLVKPPPEASAKGTSSDPIHVNVVNQINPMDMTTGMARRMNRPSSGMSGPDTRMDILTPATGAW